MNNEKYFKSLKVDNDPKLFSHAIDTEVGDVVSYGTVVANEPVSDPLIEGEYSSIEKVEQHYVQKTRTVTYTDSNGNVKTRTETYWEWVTKGRERFDTDTLTYLEREFSLDQFNVNHHNYLETVKTSSRVRYSFYTMPKEYEALIYSLAKSKTIENNEIHLGQSIEDFMDRKESEADTSVILFWVLWVILTSGVIIGFVTLDNKFINGNRSLAR